MQSEDLDRLTAQHADCLLAAYADIASGITLISGAQGPIPRETLDNLCKEAAATLGSEQNPPFGHETSPLAIKKQDGKILIFLRDPGDADCALNLVCSARVSVPVMINEALTIIQRDQTGADA